MSTPVSPQTLKSWLHDGDEIALFDVREHGQYGEAHLFFAVPLPYSRLELDVTRLAPNPAVRVVVYDDGQGDLTARACARLSALGYRNLHHLQGGSAAWLAAGFRLFAGVHLPSKTFGELVEQVCHTPRISARDLHARQHSGEPLLVLDGRPFAEYRKMSIPGARCCPNGELGYRLHSLVDDPHTPLVINCAGRTRSIIGAQTLINLGISNPVQALENGTQGWFLADLPLAHGCLDRYPDLLAPPRSHMREAAERLASRAGVSWVDARQVERWAADPQRSLFLCDVRTAEEFAEHSLPAAQHTPGGQLVQATDQYLGVRGARVVLFDSDGVRAPITASWLRQLGHQAFVLRDGIHSGLSVPVSAKPAAPLLGEIGVEALAQGLQNDSLRLLDLRPSQRFRQGHIPAAQWSIRPHLRDLPGDDSRALVLLADDAELAAWAATELPRESRARYLRGGMAAWLKAGFAQHCDASKPGHAECIDYLFFVHDRHDGNKEAARQYLAWETGLLAQLDAAELASFSPLAPD